MWLKILRQNISHLARRAKGSASIEQKNASTKSNRSNNNGVETNKNEDNGSIELKSQAGKKKPGSGGPGSGPLLQQAEVSSSQLDFFKMLDEKIENGPDYDESLDATIKAERTSELMRRWELASVSRTSLGETTNDSWRMVGVLEIADSRHCPTAKDREGMRNIIGGRPESAPVFTRNTNRLDGLQELESSSTNMPRHVLESITQSPTQSIKSQASQPLQPQSSPKSLRHQEFERTSPGLVSGCTGGRLPMSLHQSQTEAGGSGGQQLNGDFANQQALYREQYLQQTGIMTVQPQRYVAAANTGSPVLVGNVLRNNPYVQQFQLVASPQHFGPPRKRAFNAAQMT